MGENKGKSIGGGPSEGEKTEQTGEMPRCCERRGGRAKGLKLFEDGEVIKRERVRGHRKGSNVAARRTKAGVQYP